MPPFDIFYINCIIPAILGFVLLANSGRSSPGKLFLSVAMFNVAITFFITYQYLVGNYELYVYLHSFGVASILFIYPSFYQYVKLLTGKKAINYSLFLPGFLFGGLSLVFFHGLLSHSEKIFFLSEFRVSGNAYTWQLKVNAWFRIANVILLFGQVGWFYYQTHRLLYRYHDAISNTFSNPWDLNLSWVRVLNYSFIISGAACLTFYVANPVELFGTSAAISYPFYLLALVLSVLGAIGVGQRELSDKQAEDLANQKVVEKPMASELEEEIMARISNFFERRKPYLDPNLTILHVATEVGTNRTYLSNSINRLTGLNFATFVNSFRVSHAKMLLAGKERISVDEAAIKSGFNSMSSFIRTFKRLESTTPHQFLKEHKGEIPLSTKGNKNS